jgi:PAS domain S-box-containing protein
MIHLLSSLRLRLFGLVLFVAIPALGLVLYQGRVQRRLVEASSLAEARRLTDGACDAIDVAVRDSRMLLDVLARLPEARQGNNTACEVLFRDLLGGKSHDDDEGGTGPATAPARRARSAPYSNIGLVDLQGQVVASAVPLPAPVNVGDRLYFRRALATRAFAIGEYQMGRITRKPSLNVARPVLGPDGRPRAVVFAAIDLDWLSAAAAEDSLSSGAVFAVIDHRGTILARRPDPGRWVGRDLHDSPVIRAVLSRREGVFEATGSDGVPRIWSFRPVEGTRDTAAYAMLGMDRRMVFAGAERVMRRSLLLLALTSLVALLAAWLGARVFVLRPVDALVSAARRLRAGDMAVRTSMTDPGELGDLGRSFDRMADSLQDRQRELERASAAVRESYETLQAVITASPVAIVALDRERRPVLWTPAAERLFGWSAEEVIGQAQPPYIPPEDREGSHDLLGRALSGEHLTDFEVRRVRRDGKVLELSLSTALIRGPAGAAQGIVGVYLDLTAQRQLERQFHHAQKMEAIGRLAGGVAHDFNNLLTVIQGFSEMALKSTGLDAAVRRDLEEVHRAALRAADLTGQLLAFSRRQPVQPRVLDLNTLVADMAKMLQRLIGENIELETRMGPRLARIRVDPGQIEQVIVNLVVNARDAMPGGGRLVIETANHSCADGSGAPCHPSCPGPSVTLTVSDTGTGMDPETLRHLFEPFFTTKARGKGTGLGLSTVYGIVQQCGGDIEVASEPGRGTTFRVYLPQTTSVADTGRAADAARATPRGSETVLLVEDEDMVRSLVRTTLERLGYGVLEARHGKEALELAEQRGGAIDLLLTDVVMPGMGGPEVARRLSATCPGLRVLYLSGYAAIESKHRAGTPLAPLLQKPFALDALARKVREVIDGAA